MLFHTDTLINFAYKMFMFIIVLGPLVFIHELGHYFFARKFNVGISDFSIGFGPRLFSFTDAKATKWSISALPLGGYIAILENPEHAKEHPHIAGQTLEDKTYMEKMLIFLGGPLFNILSATMIALIVVSLYGISLPSNTVAKITNPNLSQQIKENDRIINIDGNEIKSAKDAHMALLGKKSAFITIAQDDKMKVIKADAQITVGTFTNQTNWGIEFAPGIKIKTNFYQSIMHAFEMIWQYIVDFIVLLKIVGTYGIAGLSGPVGIFKMIGGCAFNPELILNIMIKLSISLGLFNLLPLPLLDGGQMMIATLEKIRGKKFSDKFFTYLSYFGLILFASIFSLITFFDLNK